MRKLFAVLISVVFLLVAIPAIAGEKEELLLKKGNLELQKQNLDLQVRVLQREIPEQQASIDKALKEVNEKLGALEKTEKPAEKK